MEKIRATESSISTTIFFERDDSVPRMLRQQFTTDLYSNKTNSIFF